MLWVTIACGGFIHPGLVGHVGRECWLTMPQLLSQPTRWSCLGPLHTIKKRAAALVAFHSIESGYKALKLGWVRRRTTVSVRVLRSTTVQSNLLDRGKVFAYCSLPRRATLKVLHNQNSVCAVLYENEWLRGFCNAWFSACAILATFFFLLFPCPLCFYICILWNFQELCIQFLLEVFLKASCTSDQIPGNLDFSSYLSWLWQSELNLHACPKVQYLILHIHTHKQIYNRI